MQVPIKTFALGLLVAAGIQTASAFHVIGYMPSWQGSVSAIQYSKVTHINYAFLLPNSNGSLQAIDNASKLSSLVSTAHANNVKVLISVGGWNNGDDSAFRSLAGNSTSRTAFVNNIINFVNQYNLDGVDIDWEYPDTSAESSSYTSLMSALSSAMHSRGKLLTAAVIAYGSTGDSISSTVFGYVDWLNIMDYDNTSGVGQSTYSSAVTAFDYWVGTRGLAASKANLGVPFYSDPSDYAFWQLLQMGASANSDSWNGEGYNGIPTIKSKTTLALQRGGGIMIWELSQDATGANSLLSAIDSVIHSSGGGTTLDTTSIFHLQNLASGLSLNQQGSLTNGSKITQWTSTSTSQNLQWKFIATDSGYYRINSVKSGKDAVVQSASTTAGAGIIQWSFGSAQNDQWKPTLNGDGTYTFVNRHSGLVLEDPGSSTSTSTQMDQWGSNSGSNQKWKLVKQ